MKNTNLLKLIASLAIVFSLSACNGGGKKPSSTDSTDSSETEPVEEPKEMQISQAIAVSFDTDAGVNVADNEGVLATVKGLTFAGEIGNNTILCQYANDPDGDGSVNLLNDLYGVEVELKEGTQLLRDDGTTPLGYTDKIAVTGRITLVNGNKVVLKEASYTYEEEGSRRNWYIPMDRSYLSQYFSKARYNGLCAESTFQVVEKPTITANGGTFTVVFPGEKTALEDNDFLFEIAIPAGLSEEQIAKYNAEFAKVEVGGGVNMIYLLHHRGVMNGVLPYDFLGRSFSSGELWFEPVELNGVFTNYEDALDLVNQYADASQYVDFEVENAYSYVVDTSNATTDYSDQSYIFINQEYEKVNRLTVNAYTDTAMEDAFAIYQRLSEDGKVGTDKVWNLAGAFDADGAATQEVEEITEYVYFLQDVEAEEPEEPAGLFDGEGEGEEEDFGNVYAQAYVDISEGLVSLEFFGEYLPATYLSTADFDELAAMYKTIFDYAMVDLGEEAVESSALFGEVFKSADANYYFDYTDFNYYEDLGLYMTTLIVSVPADSNEAYYNGVLAAAETAGFVDGEFDGDAGLQNKETHEFFTLSRAALNEETGDFDFKFELTIDTSGQFVTDPIPVYDNAAAAMAGYKYSEAMAEGTSAIAGSFFDLAVEGAEYQLTAPQWDQFASYGLYLANLSIKPVPVASFNAAAGALMAKFGEGWVEGDNKAFGWTAESENVFWNATSHECVRIQFGYTDSTKTAVQIFISICIDVQGKYCVEYVPAEPEDPAGLAINSFALAR